MRCVLYALLIFASSFTFKPNEKFDICYINMEREKLRNQHMNAILKAAKCDFTRFEAIDGDKLLSGHGEISQYLNIPLHDPFLDLAKYKSISNNLRGMVGCKLSHYLNLRRISMSKRPVLILEDDVDLECDFVTQIEEALESLPECWDILCITKQLIVDRLNTGLNRISVTKIVFFTECIFLVNGFESANKLANLIQSSCKPEQPLDLFLGQKTAERKIEAFCLNKNLVTQMRSKFKSSIPSSGALSQKKLINSLYEFTLNLIS